MVDSRFFDGSDALTIAHIIEHLREKGDVDLEVRGDANKMIKSVATLKTALPDDLSFFHNAKYVDDLRVSQAGVIITDQKYLDMLPKHCTAILSPAPYRTYAYAAQVLYPEHDAFINDHNDGAEVHVSESVVCEPNVLVKSGAEIGAGTKVGANTVIGRGVKIGKNCRIGQNVTLSHCSIGDDVTILPGTRIGQAGFGFYMDEKGAVSVPQLGRVIIEDYVDIGANVTIDRGALEDTFVGKGTRIDNLVQLGHGVRLGQGCIVVAQVGISGSTEFGNYVIAAGQAGFSGHLKIGDGAQIAAKAGVMRNIEPGSKVGGFPAVPIRQWHKQSATLAKLATEKK